MYMSNTMKDVWRVMYYFLDVEEFALSETELISPASVRGKIRSLRREDEIADYNERDLHLPTHLHSYFDLVCGEWFIESTNGHFIARFQCVACDECPHDRDIEVGHRGFDGRVQESRRLSQAI